jgi:hypothetical protein
MLPEGTPRGQSLIVQLSAAARSDAPIIDRTIAADSAARIPLVLGVCRCRVTSLIPDA